MTFDELIGDLQRVPFDEERKRYDGYLEFVMSEKHMMHLYPVLEKHFGVPFKPPGVAPTSQADDYAKAYGGVMKHQTLYFLKKDGWAHCALLWPWNDGSRVTVKVAQGRLQEIRH